MNRKGIRAYQARLLRERKKSKAMLELSIRDCLLHIINTCTISRGIYSVPRLTLIDDLIKFMKENSDEINQIK